jgi:hypothetical protein
MKKTAELLEKKFLAGRDLIGMWESELRLEFPFPRFAVELSDPIQSQGTSLMAERDSFSRWAEPDRIFTMISDEIGTHILVQTMRLDEPSFGKTFEGKTEMVLRLVEALAYLLNVKICAKLGTACDYSPAFAKHFNDEITSLRCHWKLGKQADFGNQSY